MGSPARVSIQAARRDLAELTERHGTDKGPASITRSSRFGRKHTLSGKGYTDTYAHFFDVLRDQPIRLLEIGIDRGASIPVWEEFFPHGTLAAIDIEERCARYQTDRTRVHIGSQTDPDFLRRVNAASGPFDVVIDDGGHMMDHHHVSLTTLWPLLPAGALYVIEDLHTAYMPEFGGGYLADASTIEKLKRVIDGMHHHAEAPQIVAGVAGMWIAGSIVVLVKA
jgi:hypothetical protein